MQDNAGPPAVPSWQGAEHNGAVGMANPMFQQPGFQQPGFQQQMMQQPGQQMMQQPGQQMMHQPMGGAPPNFQQPQQPAGFQQQMMQQPMSGFQASNGAPGGIHLQPGLQGGGGFQPQLGLAPGVAQMPNFQPPGGGPAGIQIPNGGIHLHMPGAAGGQLPGIQLPANLNIQPGGLLKLPLGLVQPGSNPTLSMAPGGSMPAERLITRPTAAEPCPEPGTNPDSAGCVLLYHRFPECNPV